MKKIIFRMFLFTIAVLAPVSAMARVSVHVSIPLPPPIIFPAPPEVVVIPETNVYAVPDIQDDIFFYGGWWWRPWEGRWYRSRYHDKGWVSFRGVPSFHQQIPPRWREDYRARHWKGYEWEQQRVPHRELKRKWRTWEREKYWEKRNAWGVKRLYKEKYEERYKKRPSSRTRHDSRHEEPPQGPPPPPRHYR